MAYTEEEKRLRNNASAARSKKRNNYEANKRSNQKNSTTFLVRMSYSTDGDLIEFLNGLENKNGYLRELIRKDMIARQTGKSDVPTRIIPLFGASFAAGVGEPDFGNAYEDYEIPADQKGDFAVRVNGDSMEPYLPDGSIQIGIKGTPQDGDVAALLVDGAFYIKQVCIDSFGNLYLFSLNRARKDLDLPVWASGENKVLCFGKILMNERVPLPRD
mgnify:CR=1 FL=1